MGDPTTPANAGHTGQRQPTPANAGHTGHTGHTGIKSQMDGTIFF